MSGKVSIQSQIAAVDAVASGRVSVIVTSVSQRELLQKQLGSAAETLRWVAQNEASVRAYVESRKGGRS
jgi:ABC-type phosphate/phosphonate transport system substrate-binding protein